MPMRRISTSLAELPFFGLPTFCSNSLILKKKMRVLKHQIALSRSLHDSNLIQCSGFLYLLQPVATKFACCRSLYAESAAWNPQKESHHSYSYLHTPCLSWFLETGVVCLCQELCLGVWKDLPAFLRSGFPLSFDNDSGPVVSLCAVAWLHWQWLKLCRLSAFASPLTEPS